MRVNRKIPFLVRNVALAAALVTVWTHAGATLVADGKLGLAPVGDAHGTAAAALAEGYDLGWNIVFSDDKGVLHEGQLWFGTGMDGTQFLYYMLPLDFVDNTYGTNSSQGWIDGAKGTHTFGNLLGSDSMGASPNFQWTDQNDKAHAAFPNQNAARVDYIAECYDGKSGSVTDALNCGAGNTSGYKSAGVGTGLGVVVGANGSGANWDKEDSSLSGTAASILEIATSLEYNLKNIDPAALVDSSTDANWIKEVGYELQFAAGTFDVDKWGKDLQLVAGQVTIPGLLVLGDPHVSPPMDGKFTSYKPPCLIGSPGCAAPEPGTIPLLAAGMAGMMWYARRRKEKAAPEAPRRFAPS